MTRRRQPIARAVERPPQVVVEKDVPITVRDGTILRADVYRPLAAGRYPVLLGRTPYGKESWGSWIEPVRTAAQGYAIVINDVRGRFTSDGELDPFATDVEDGADVVEWCAGQPWSSGRVGMFGSSAPGYSQLLAAVGQPEGLTSIAPWQTWSSFGRGCVFDPGGAFSMYTQEWALQMATTDPARLLGADRADFGERYDAAARALWDIGQWHGHRPLRTFPPLPVDGAGYFYRWLEHPDHDGWWRDRDLVGRYDRIALPVFHLAGWFDRFCRSTVANYLALRETCPSQKLVLGPWPHGVPVAIASGDRHFGTRAWVDARALVLRWHERWLKDVRNGIDDEPPVRLYVLGEDLWRDEKAWPLARARPTAWHLRSGGSANTRSGDGRLEPEPASPGDEPTDRFVFDPADPTPSVPGRPARPWGTVDQGPIEDRPDVLCYTSTRLDRDLEVTGPVTMRLWAASGARDADWVVKLVDVYPDGYIFRLCEGMIRARYRDSQERPTPVEPDRVYEYQIDLGPISNLFRAGHRIRVEVAGGSFPQFDANTGTGGPFGTEATGIPAPARVLHDAGHPSHVVLPVVPR